MESSVDMNALLVIETTKSIKFSYIHGRRCPLAKNVPPDADGHFCVLSRQLRRDLDTDGGAMFSKDYSQRMLLTSRLLAGC